MKISVIIPCYNAARTLGGQLDALARQDVQGLWEVIVVDNGSTDNSIALAKSFKKRLPRMRVISAPARRGAAYARNCGAAEARSELLAFCDADDEVAPGYVRAMIDALSVHPFVACRYEFRKLNRHWITRCHTDLQLHKLDSGLLGRYSYAGGGSLGARKAVHESVGGFDESFPALEDTDYCIRLQRAGFPLHFTTGPLVHVRWRTSVMDAFGQARNWGRSFVAVRRRHTPLKDAPDTPLSLFRHLLLIRRVRNSDQLAKWIWATGWKIGAIEGWREQQRNGGVTGTAALF